MQNNKLSHFEMLFSLIVGFIAGVLIVIGYFISLSETPTSQNTFVPQAYAAEEIAQVSSPSAYVTESPKYQHTYTGYVSYYSHDGCLGCSENQTMGNGQPFDENAMTLAVPCELIRSKELKYNTSARVTNEQTGKSVIARLTDCGGFGKYRRVADLSKGLFETLEARTDQTIITIEVL